MYLARGRDIEKPPVIVLLDGDKAGDDARTALKKGGAYGNRLIREEFVLQLTDAELSGIQADNPGGVVGIEDLVPLEIAISAAGLYCAEFVPTVDVAALDLEHQAVFEHSDSSRNRGLLSCLEAAIGKRTGLADFHLDKVGFARSVVDCLTGGLDDAPAVSQAAEDQAHNNFTILLPSLTRRQRAAQRAETAEKISSRINRIKRDFTRTHPTSVRREDALALIEEIASQLDHSPEAEDVRREMSSWERLFALDGEPRGLVEDYEGLIKAVRSLAYKGMRQSSAKRPANLAVAGDERSADD